MSRTTEGPYRDRRRGASSGRLSYGRLSPLRFPFFLLTVVFLLALAAGFVGQVHWLFELCTHFPLQLALGLGACAVVLALFAAWRWVLVAALGCGLAVAQVWPVAHESASAGSIPVTADLRVLLANVHTQNRSFDLVIKEIRSVRADLVVIQEAGNDWVAALEPELSDYPVRLSVAREDNFGMLIAARDRRTAMRWVTGNALENPPSALLSLPVGERLVKTLVLHAMPPSRGDFAVKRNEQLAAAARVLATEEGPKLLVGDLNATPWSPYFLRLVRDAGVIDPRRQGFGRVPTWPAQVPSLLRIPIDHILAGGGLEVVRLSAGGKIGSDHLPLIADLRLRAE